MNSLLLAILAVLLCQPVWSNQYCGQYNCYDLLGVSKQAEQQQIRKAFREMARKYHPDKNKNKEDTTEFFQFINKALEILTDDKSRFMYNLHLANPQESEYYHQYRYYQNKYIQNPQIHPLLVVLLVLVLASALQYVMRKQMYERAIIQISESQDFKAKVNERCKNKKQLKERTRQQMIDEIQIEGGYSKPQIKDILLLKIVLLPVRIYNFIKSKCLWFYRYTIKKLPYSSQDQILLTKKALGYTQTQWNSMEQSYQQELVSKSLWIKQNLTDFQEQSKRKWLQQLRVQNPRAYKYYQEQARKNK